MWEARMSDRDFEKARNARWRKVSKWLRPAYRALARIIEPSLDFFVLDLTRAKPVLYSVHATDYARYEEVQIEANIRKIQSGTDLEHWKAIRLKTVVDDIVKHFPVGQETLRGICMGARNGTEVRAFRELLDPLTTQSPEKPYCRAVEIVGTDISPTASDFDLVQHDFNYPIPHELGKFDFVFSTSLDQTQTPVQALQAWMSALAPGGRIYLEFTPEHGKQAKSELDPFSCEPEFFPFVILKWFHGKIAVVEILQTDSSHDRKGVFVLKQRE